MSIKKWVLMILLLLGAGGAFFYVKSAAKAPVAEEKAQKAVVIAVPRVDVVAATVRTRMLSGIEATCTLKASADVVLLAKVTGRLQAFQVRRGDRVQKGQVVAVLDHREADAQLGSVNAQVSVSQASLAQAKAQLDSALRERDRYARLLKEGYATQQELDTRETTYSTAKATYGQAQASVKQSQANLRAQDVSRTEYTLKVPIDGMVLDDYGLAVGTMISPSTPVTKIAYVEELKALLQIPESQVSLVKEGMKALLTGEGFPGREVVGRVYRVSPFVDTATRTLQVEVAVENHDGALKPGMFAKVFLVAEEAADALVVPAASVRDGRVLVVKNGKVAEKPVKTGLALSDAVQVLSGIESGDLVVVGGGTLKDGDAVQPNEVVE